MERVSKKIIYRLKHGDKDAFEDVFIIYKDRIYYFAFKYLKNHQDSQDIVAETFLHAIENINQFSGLAVCFNMWIMTIAKNCIIDLLRKKKRDNDFYKFSNDDVEDAPDQCPVVDDIEIIDIKEFLGERLFDILLRKFVYGETLKTIAKAYNTSTESIRREIKHALKKLKRYKEKGSI